MHKILSMKYCILLLLILNMAILSACDLITNDVINIKNDGEIKVEIRDKDTNKAIENAQVKLAGEVVSYSDSEGLVNIHNIEKGDYKIEVLAEGYEDYSIDDISVGIDLQTYKIYLQPV